MWSVNSSATVKDLRDKFTLLVSIFDLPLTKEVGLRLDEIRVIRMKGK